MPVTLLRLSQVRRPDSFDDTKTQNDLNNLESAAVDMQDVIDGLLSNMKLTKGTTNWYDGVSENIQTLAARAKLEDKLALKRVQVLTSVTVPENKNLAVLRVDQSEAPALAIAVAGTNKGAVAARISVGTASTLTTGVEGNNNAILWTAVTKGVWGTGIKITINTNPGLNHSLTLVLTGNNTNFMADYSIEVQSATDGAGDPTSTAQDVINAVAADGTISKLVTAANYGTSSGLGIIAASVQNNLQGGTGGLGAHALDEVAGANAVSPKNLVVIRDGSTRDPIQDSGAEVFGLLQVSDQAVDGGNADDYKNLFQVSFVKRSGDDLVAAEVSSVSLKVIEYMYVRRNDLYSLGEQDYLGDGVFSDMGAAVGISLDSAYDGGTIISVDGNPVDWQLADYAEFKVSDGSTAFLDIIRNDMNGDEVNIGSDKFHVSSTDVDFDSGLNANGLSIFEVTGYVDRTGADLEIRTLTSGNLGLTSAGELNLSDSRKSNVPLTDAVDTDWAAALESPASLVAAINKAATLGGVDLTFAVKVLASDYAQDENVPGGSWIDLSGRSIDANTPTGVDTFIFLNGRLLYGGNGTTNNDVYAGTTPADGDLKFDFADGVKTGDVLFAVSFQQ